MDTTTFRLQPDNYFQDQHPKDLIVLHFTAGLSARSAYQTWITPVAGVAQHVSTAYVVDLIRMERPGWARNTASPWWRPGTRITSAPQPIGHSVFRAPD